jgi:hypothetical protein
MIAFLWSVAVEGLAAFVVLALLPSDIENRVWLVYSTPRLVMMSVVLVSSAVCITDTRAFPIVRRKRPLVLAHVAKLFCCPLASLGLWAISLGTIVLVLAGSLALPVGRTGMLLRRALPLSAWGCLVALEVTWMQRRLGGAGLRQTGRWILDGLDDLAGRARAWLAIPAIPLVGAVLCAAFLLGSLVARSGFPSGYAGLFTLMSEMITSNSFHLPEHVPYYGPGGIPFAYPPLGLYLMALVTGVLHVPEFTYLRYAPVVFSLLAMLPFYGVLRILAGRDRPADNALPVGSTNALALANAEAGLGVLLLALSPRLFMAQGEAAGATRALGFLFSMCAVYCVVRLSESGGVAVWAWSGLTVLAVALTILSHLNYLAFEIAVFGALVLSGEKTLLPFWKRLGLLLAAGLGGILLASPWWGTLASRYGVGVILNAAFSHGNLSAPSLSDFLQRMVDSLTPLYRSPFLGAGLVLGFIYHLSTRRWFFPLAILGVLALSLGDWLVAPFAAAMAAEILVELARLVLARTKEFSYRFKALPAAGFLLLVLAAACYNSTRQIESISPVIVESTQAAADWLRENTPDRERYLFFTASADEAEWLPWLARRTPVAGSWGAEWKGDFGDQLNSLNEVSACASRSSQSCVDGLIQRLYPGVLIASRQRVDSNLVPVLSGQTGWKQVYENSDYIVWERD